MPRILPTFAAVIIVGVCIAFNTMRYPIVWDMVGLGGTTAHGEKEAPAAEAALVAGTASSEKPAPSSVAVQDAPKSSEVPPKADPPEPAKVEEKPAAPKAVPISLPKEEFAAVDLKQDAEKKEKAENNQQAEEKLVEPPRRLVPVASDPISAGAPDIPQDEIVRLPPLEMEDPLPAARLAVDSPNSPIPIYPSTGK